jgi:hypothetical protein
MEGRQAGHGAPSIAIRAKAESMRFCLPSRTDRDCLRRVKKPLVLAIGMLAAACVPAADIPPPAAAPTPLAPPPAPTYSTHGLESVMGRGARALIGLFGNPDLDIREGTARKLQFAGPACVLDVYLYPPQGGGEPVATHVDARMPDGRDIDRSSCVAALSRPGEAR